MRIFFQKKRAKIVPTVNFLITQQLKKTNNPDMSRLLTSQFFSAEPASLLLQKRLNQQHSLDDKFLIGRRFCFPSANFHKLNSPKLNVQLQFSVSKLTFVRNYLRDFLQQ